MPNMTSRPQEIFRGRWFQKLQTQHGDVSKNCERNAYYKTLTFLPKMCSARIILNRLTPSFAKKGLVLEVQLVDTVSRMHSHWILWKVSDHPLTLRPSESPFIHLYHFFKFESESEQTEIRNWCQLMPNAAKLSNCYRSRKTDEQMNMRVPQSFSFFPREGVGASML